MEKKLCIPMREAQAREAPVIERFIIVITIPVIRKGVIIVPVPPTLNIIRMIAEPCTIGMETGTGVTALRRMTVEDTTILSAEEVEKLPATDFPAV